MEITRVYLKECSSSSVEKGEGQCPFCCQYKVQLKNVQQTLEEKMIEIRKIKKMFGQQIEDESFIHSLQNEIQITKENYIKLKQDLARLELQNERLIEENGEIFEKNHELQKQLIKIKASKQSKRNSDKTNESQISAFSQIGNTDRRDVTYKYTKPNKQCQIQKIIQKDGNHKYIGPRDEKYERYLSQRQNIQEQRKIQLTKLRTILDHM